MVVLQSTYKRCLKALFNATKLTYEQDAEISRLYYLLRESTLYEVIDMFVAPDMQESAREYIKLKINKLSG